MDDLLKQLNAITDGKDGLFYQMGIISKAQGYDIITEQVKELKLIIRELIEVGELEDITFTDDADTAEFQKIVNRAKIISL